MQRRTALKLMGASGLAMLASPSFAVEQWLNEDITRADFGNDFLWGVATAAYQIEGAHDVDGKTESIWDRFTAKPKNIKDGSNGRVACDFYNRYATDINLIKQMNMQVNRFSLAWTRILPNGVGQINQKGIDFYNKIIDTTLQNGLQPWITIYHWDLPQVLEDKGGWANRDMLQWFTEYADVCTRKFGDRVKNWMVLNEPMAFTGLGYMAGVHAPGRKGFGSFFPAAHHAALCQAEGGRVVRNNVTDANVGTTFSCAHIDAASAKDTEAALRMDALINRLFIEPSLGLGYPSDHINFAKKLEKHMKDGDEARLKFDFDFIGIQNYTRNVVKKAMFPPVLWAKEILAKDRQVPEITEMGWEVYPDGIYHLLKKFGAYKGIKKILVTENGAAFPDTVENGAVHDSKRVQFFKSYLKSVLKAKQEGVNVQGYFVWTLMDNFEWAEGYHPRFGLVHVDFASQQRVMKDSGLWFRDFLK